MVVGETREIHKDDKFIGPTTPWHKHQPQNTNALPCHGMGNQRQ